MKQSKWLSPPPEKCDICERKIEKTFVDGKTLFGPWACMCKPCHRDHGGKLGLGLGQLYEKKDEEWVKTKG